MVKSIWETYGKCFAILDIHELYDIECNNLETTKPDDVWTSEFYLFLHKKQIKLRNILTKNLVLKNKMGLKMENFHVFGVYWKFQLLGVGSRKTNIERGAWAVCRFKGGGLGTE